MDRHVTVQVDGDDLVVTQANLFADRRARMMFDSVLGAIPKGDGWRCPRRRSSMEGLVVRVNSFLEREGWTVDLEGLAGVAVRRAIEQQRSFQRTRHFAEELRLGRGQVDLSQVRASLNEFGWDDGQRRLLPHQELGLLQGLTAINAANFSVPGSGKTATTLALAAVHLQTNAIDVIVVVGPLSCFRPWEAEASAALPGKVKPVRVRGSREQRWEFYRSAQAKQILLVSYAAAAADRSHLVSMCDSLKTMLVVDESHRIKRFRGGVWAPALQEIAKHARVRIVLSGTPMPSSGRDLYSQLKVLWPAAELTGSQSAFSTEVDQDFGRVLRRIQPFLTRTPKEALGLRPYEVIRHDVALRDTQRDVYNLILEGLRRRIERADLWNSKIESLKRGRPIRLLQAATNPDTLNSADRYYRLSRLTDSNPTLMERLAAYAERETPAKFKPALGIITRIASDGGKVVCWSNFISNLDQFAEYVRERLVVPVFQVDGRIPIGDESEYDASDCSDRDFRELETRESIIANFLNESDSAVLVANPASCSESISLHHSCHNAIYLDRTYDGALYWQSIDRIHRLGLHPETEVSVHIISSTIDGRPTIDGLVELSLQRKEGRMRRLLEGAELAPLAQPLDAGSSADGDEEDLEHLLRFLMGEEMSTQ